MEDKIAQLMDRYGRYHDYQSLSEGQTAFLLDPEIKDHKDGCGWHTVLMDGLNKGADGLILAVMDTYHYISNDLGGRGAYAAARIPIFQKALGITSEPKKLDGLQIYLFDLPHGSKVRVQYAIWKDKP